MFDHLRADLTAQLAQARTATEQATNALAQANAAATAASASLQNATQALAQAQGAAAAAASDLTAKQAAANQAQQQRDAAQQELTEAQAALELLLDSGDRQIGKPSPGHPVTPVDPGELQQARKRVTEAKAALAAAVTTLQQAQAALGAASAAANAANAARDAAQHARDTAAAALAAAQARIPVLTSARDQSAQTETTLTAQLGALDQRAARLLADPLNRPDVQQAADSELSSLLALRGQRLDLYRQRFTAANQRAAALTSQDGTADRLQTLASLIRAWPDVGRYPQLTGVLSAIDGIVSASQSQRQRPAHNRTDDLAGAQATLSAQLAQLNAASQQAAGEQAAAATALSNAAKALADWEASS